MTIKRQLGKGRPQTRPAGPPLQASARRVYVMVAHGIGARDPGDFAAKSVAPLVTWVEAAGPDRWQRTGCLTGCSMGEGHDHVISNNPTPVQIDFEPFYWADCVTRPGRGRIAWWVFKAGCALIVLDVITSVFALLGTFKGKRAASIVDFWRIATTPFVMLFHILFLALGIPVAVIATLICKKVASRLGDALAWSIDEDSQEKILRKADAQLSAHKADRTVLIGHSQGGSILTQLTREQPSRYRSVMLITLGSGQGILAMLSEIGSRGVARSILLVGMYVSVLIGMCIALLEPMAQLVSHFVQFVFTYLELGKAFWLLAAAPETSMFLVAQVDQRSSELLVETLTRTSQTSDLGFSFFVGVLLLIAFLATMAFAQPLIKEVLDRSRSDVSGVDLVASHDPVAAAMQVLGLPGRVQKVTQTASLLTDHTSYFRNGASVLPVLGTAIHLAAVGSGTKEAEGVELRRAAEKSGEVEHKGVTRTLRLVRLAVALFVGGAIASLFQGGVTTPLALVILVVAATLTAFLFTTRALGLLDRGRMMNSNMSQYLTTLGRSRSDRRSPWRAGLLAVLGIPLMGAAMVLPGEILDVGAANNLQPLIGFAWIVAVTLGVASMGYVLGSVQAPACATIGLFLGAGVWFAQDTTMGRVLAVVLLAISVIYVWDIKSHGRVKTARS